MERRLLGRSGLSIAPLVFGGNVFGWTADEPTSFDLLDRFVERGFNAIDSADVYSSFVPGNTGGESETVIGNWLKRRGRRDDVVIMTKVGMLEGREGLSTANIETAVEESLRRLQTDYLDVYFAHLDDANTPLEETLTAFARLVEAGKVRVLGASNYEPERVDAALVTATDRQLPRYEVLQPGYNLYDRTFERGLAALATERELGVTCYFGLASGFLTGKYRSIDDVVGTSRASLLEQYFDERGQRILAELRETAEELSVSPAQVALAWLMGRPGVTAAIASATRLAQLDDIMGAAELELPAEAMERLTRAGA
ncbi:MAG: aldo/keto reductase [Halofilum sp. (in: g-proteobacteria)]